MPSPQFTYFKTSQGSVNIPNGAETVAIASLQVSSSYAGCQFLIYWWASVAVPALLTTINVKIERGATAGGTVVAATGPINVTASTQALFTWAAVDAPNADLASAQWCVTLTTAGGGANTTLTNQVISVVVAE